MNDSRLTMLASVDQLAMEILPVSSLHPGDSPRLTGVNGDHIRTLAENDGPLPPIIVHRTTMRVIDGMHRLHAAKLRGDQDVSVRLFDGDVDSAFVLAVEANIAHGLPLTLAERVAAAARILASSPESSDRAIAAVTGLASATIGGIRRRTTVHGEHLNTRVGLDGKVRPVSSAEGRRLASALIAGNPRASLREIAREAGVSPTTVRDVRERLDRGDDPVPPSQHRRERRARRGHRVDSPAAAPANRAVAVRPVTILENLQRDPSLRYNQVGRTILIWLMRHTVHLGQWQEFVHRVPAHCTGVLAELARGSAAAWNSFADELEERARGELARNPAPAHGQAGDSSSRAEGVLRGRAAAGRLNEPRGAVT